MRKRVFLRNDKKQDSTKWVAILFSITLHFGILALKLKNASVPLDAQPKEDLIELAPVPKVLSPQTKAQVPTPAPKSQIVETEDAGNREVDPNATMLSEHNQKATQEMRAKNIDDFRKGSGTGPKANQIPNQPSLPPTGDDSQESEDQNDIALGTGESTPKNPGVKRNWKDLSLKDLSVGGDGSPSSASDDYLPHVDTGERTILSTREFRYFSYYNRIKDILRQFWKPSVEREVAKLWGKGRMLNENELTTRVLVLLDKTGQVQKISKIANSGISEIDEAAVQAFYQASPFPNPPHGLIDADGFVRINWDFILQTASAPRIQFRPGGGRAFR